MPAELSSKAGRLTVDERVLPEASGLPSGGFTDAHEIRCTEGLSERPAVCRGQAVGAVFRRADEALSRTHWAGRLSEAAAGSGWWRRCGTAVRRR